jgi:hypothetical protein
MSSNAFPVSSADAVAFAAAIVRAHAAAPVDDAGNQNFRELVTRLTFSFQMVIARARTAAGSRSAGVAPALAPRAAAPAASIAAPAAPAAVARATKAKGRCSGKGGGGPNGGPNGYSLYSAHVIKSGALAHIGAAFLICSAPSFRTGTHCRRARKRAGRRGPSRRARAVGSSRLRRRS